MTTVPVVEPDLLSLGFALDPHDTYDALRRLGPAWWDEATSCWYVTTYDEVSELLRDRRLSARIGDGFLGAHDAGDHEAADVLEFFGAWPMFSDPPEHSVTRRRVAGHYRPLAVQPLRESIAAEAASLLARCDPRSADLLGEFVQPLAISVTCDLLGIPLERREDLLTWSSDIIGFIGVPVLDPARAPRARVAIDNLTHYLRTQARPAVDAGTATPQLEALLSLPEPAARALFAQILTGGIEPVVGCAGGVLGHLFGDSRAVATQLMDGVLTAERVAEEALRFEAPFHFVPRTATAHLEVGDRRISPGERVALVVAAANRDPGRHHAPERFRVPPADQPDPPHLSFGLGAHFCLGAGLARLTLTEVVRSGVSWMTEHEVGPLDVRRNPAFGHTVWRRIGLGY